MRVYLSLAICGGYKVIVGQGKMLQEVFVLITLAEEQLKYVSAIAMKTT